MDAVHVLVFVPVMMDGQANAANKVCKWVIRQQSVYIYMKYQCTIIIMHGMHNSLHSAVCTQGCHNGGRCTEPDTCSCAEGWTGFSCTEGSNWITILCMHVTMKIKQCYSYMMCACVNNRFKLHLICLCVTAVCSPECQHGGECVEPGICRCTSRWSGNSCEQGIYRLMVT